LRPLAIQQEEIHDKDLERKNQHRAFYPKYLEIYKNEVIKREEINEEGHKIKKVYYPNLWPYMLYNEFFLNPCRSVI
jgi:hypothetical protein